MLGVTLVAIDSGGMGAVALQGVYSDIPKVGGAVFAAGEKLLWDVSAAGGSGAFDSSAATVDVGDVMGGAIAWEAGAEGDTSCTVKLTPSNATPMMGGEPAPEPILDITFVTDPVSVETPDYGFQMASGEVLRGELVSFSPDGLSNQFSDIYVNTVEGLAYAYFYGATSEAQTAIGHDAMEARFYTGGSLIVTVPSATLEMDGTIWSDGNRYLTLTGIELLTDTEYRLRFWPATP